MVASIKKCGYFEQSQDEEEEEEEEEEEAAAESENIAEEQEGSGDDNEPTAQVNPCFCLVTKHTLNTTSWVFIFAEKEEFGKLLLFTLVKCT